MQKDDAKVITFATIICVTCSLLLSSTAAALRERQDRNIELDRKLNVLQAFGEKVKNEKGKKIVTPSEIEMSFETHIVEVIVDAATGEVLEGLSSADLSDDDVEKKLKLPLYLWKEGEDVTRYAFPISGYGLWSTIYGYLALDKDLATILGVTFYKHGETPGLGGECEKPWFQQNFADKVLWKDGELVQFKVWKGKAPEGNDHAVDGMSGATITGNGITTFLNDDMAKYDKYFSRIRGG